MRHLKPFLMTFATLMLVFGFQNCGRTEFGQVESQSQSVNGQVPPPGTGGVLAPPAASDSAGEESCTDDIRFASTMYRCDTNRGSIYFRHHCSSVPGAYHVYHPVGTLYSSSTTECTNSNIAVSGGRMSCLFYNDSRGRWVVNISTDQLPQVIRTFISDNWDCDHYALQPGVTPAECKAQYSCYRVQ